MSRLHKLLRRLLAAALGLILVAFGVEAFVRIANPFGVLHFLDMADYASAREWVPEVQAVLDGRPAAELDLAESRLFGHAPNLELELRTWSVVTDSRGMRGPEREIPKPADVRRILLLGDSIAFGQGVDYEATFGHLVEEELNASGDVRWEVVNAAVPAYDSLQSLATLRTVGFEYEPDVVCLVYCNNDVTPTHLLYAARSAEFDPETAARFEQARAFARRTAFLEPWLPSTHALVSYLYRRRNMGTLEGTPEFSRSVGIDIDAGFRTSIEALLEIRALCEAREVPFVVFESTPMVQLEEACDAEGLLFASIAWTAEEQAVPGLRNSVSDPHASPLGHRLHARHMLDELERLGLLP